MFAHAIAERHDLDVEVVLVGKKGPGDLAIHDLAIHVDRIGVVSAFVTAADAPGESDSPFGRGHPIESALVNVHVEVSVLVGELTLLLIAGVGMRWPGVGGASLRLAQLVLCSF